MELTFATKETIKQPKNKIPLKHEIKPNDHVMGVGFFTGPEWKVTCFHGQWTDIVIKVEIQKNIFGDTYWCVTFSCNNCHEILHVKLYGVEINKSERFLAIASGTIRGQGNSKGKVAETNRTVGFVKEEACPFLPSTSIDEAYAPLDTKLYDLAKQSLAMYEFGYKWLKDNKPETLKVGLQFSPVQVDVESYAFNEAGLIINSGGDYIHEVIIIGYVEGEYWIVMDSENQQFVKFDWGYNFGTPMIHNLKKKFMPLIYKQQGSPALYFKHWSQDLLIPIADGVLVGGDLFKTLLGTSDYSSIPRVKNNGQDWVTLPFPVAPYSFLTKIV